VRGARGLDRHRALAACGFTTGGPLWRLRASWYRRRPLERIGQYTIVRVLGEGNTAIVYEAREELSHRDVALKVLRDGVVVSQKAREDFVREMSILSRIDHPNVVRLLASMELDGKLVMVLELIRGETLRQRLVRGGRVQWQEALRIAQQILAGLSAAHAQRPPVVHRDLKPEDVMLGEHGTAKVMDFGVAKVVREGTLESTDVGAIEYMSPEQIEGTGLDTRADLYNVGLILYEMLAGTPPFCGRPTRDLIIAQATEPPPPLPAHAGPPGLLRIIDLLLTKSPDGRPQTAAAAQQLLSQVEYAAAAAAHPAVAMSPAASIGGPAHHNGSASASARTSAPPRASKGLSLAVVILIAIGVFALGGILALLYLRSNATDGDDDLHDDNGDGSTVVASAAPPEALALGVVACAVRGRASGVDDFVALADADEPTLVWIDGATGEQYRTRTIDEERVYCIAPGLLGHVRDDKRRLELLDAQSGEPVSVVTTKLGVKTMQRDGDRILITQPDGSKLKAKLSKCGGCEGSHEVGFGQLQRSEGAPGSTAGLTGLCAGPRGPLAHGDRRYEIDEAEGAVVVSARKGDTELWAARVDHGKGGVALRCALAVNDQAVGVLVVNREDGDAEIELLDPSNGKARGRVAIGPIGPSDFAARAFFANAKLFIVQTATQQLIAVDPDDRSVAWRR
jgi:serine/threonine-protein kinase